MRFGLLGPLQVLAPDETDVPVRGAKQRALLTMMLLARGEVVSADRLIEAVWTGELPGNPLNALQAQMTQLRRALGSETVVTAGGGYSVPGADLDLDDLADLVGRARVALDRGDPDRAAQLAEEAERLWRGPALVDVELDDDITRAEVARAEELRRSAAELRLEADIHAGRHQTAAAELEALVAVHPFRERLWELLLLALYRSGRQTEALRAYQQARTILVEELGVEPGPALRELESKILAQDPTMSAADAHPHRGNLPAALDSFIGRAEAVRTLQEALDGHRLITVVGPGGAGKTRLAIEVARGLRLPGGTWLVPLEGLADPAGLLATVASAVGAREDDGTGTSGTQRLAARLGADPTVVVVDNCEHLVRDVAHLVADLLRTCPDLTVLATSREGLGLPGERLVPLDGLAVEDAIDLFIERARAVRPDLRADEDLRRDVAEICARLDGLPLAIELAAARARSLPVNQISERLADRFRLLTGGSRTSLPRHQTLRAVIDWSHDLLFEDERRLFRRLAVFAGDFSLQAAESVCSDDGLGADDVFDVLVRLVEKSLCVPQRAATPRYRMLQTVVEYARERLDEAGEAVEMRTRHGSYFSDVARRAEPDLRNHAALQTRDRLSEDLENFWAALDHHVESDDADLAMRLADDLAWLWFLRGEWSEAVRFCARALTAEGEVADDLRGIVQTWWAYYLAATAGHRALVDLDPDVLATLDAGVAAVEAAGDPIRLAKARLLRTSLAQRSGDTSAQVRWFNAALEAAERAADEGLIATAEMLGALTMLRIADQDAAQQLAESSIERFERVGGEALSIEARTVLLTIYELDGRVDDALRLAEDIVAMADAYGIPGYRQWALSRLGFLRCAAGDLDAAAAAHEASLAIGTSQWGNALAQLGKGLVARRRGDLTEADNLLEEAARIYQRFGAAAETALALVLSGWVALDRGDPMAARHYVDRARKEMAVASDDGVSAMASEVRAAAALAEHDLVTARNELLPSAPLGIPAGHGIWLLTRDDSQRLRRAIESEPSRARLAVDPR